MNIGDKMAAIPKIDCTTSEFNRKFDETYAMLLKDRRKFSEKMSSYCDNVLYPDVEKRNSVTLKYFRGLAKHRQDVIVTSTEMCAFAMTWMYFAKGRGSLTTIRPQTVKKRTKTNQMGLDFYLGKR